jgi:hypothetical protein
MLRVNHSLNWEMGTLLGDSAMMDPRDFDRRMDMDRRIELDSRADAPTPWGWIAGAVFIVVVLALVFTSGNTNKTAIDESSPPATTGMAPRTAPPLATVPPARTMPSTQTPSTTGQ